MRWNVLKENSAKLAKCKSVVHAEKKHVAKKMTLNSGRDYELILEFMPEGFDHVAHPDDARYPASTL